MERIKFGDGKPLPHNIHRVVAEQSKAVREKAAKTRRKPKPKPESDEINYDSPDMLAVRYRLRDIMEARFGHSPWMDLLPPLSKSGLVKDEKGVYRLSVEKRVK